MTVDIQFQEDGTVYGWADGVLRFDDLYPQLQAMWTDPRFGPGTRQMLDLRKLKAVEFEAADFRKVVAEAVAQPDIFKGGCIAIVAPNDSVFGMMRMFEQLADSVPGDIQVFRDFDKAKAWVQSYNE